MPRSNTWSSDSRNDLSPKNIVHNFIAYGYGTVDGDVGKILNCDEGTKEITFRLSKNNWVREPQSPSSKANKLRISIDSFLLAEDVIYMVSTF